MAIDFYCTNGKVQLFFDGVIFLEADQRRILQLSGKDFLPKFIGTRVENIPSDISFYIADLPDDLSFLHSIVLDNLKQGFSITLMTDIINRDTWVRNYSFSEYVSKIEELLDCCIPPIKSYKKSSWEEPSYDHSFLGVKFELNSGDLFNYVLECANKLSRALNEAGRLLSISKSTEQAAHRVICDFTENVNCDLEENLTTEFKEIKGRNPKSSIQKAMGKYLISFLNVEGGSIYWGIDDSGLVKGVELTSKQKDEINISLTAEINNIEPAIDPTKVKIIYHEVLKNKGAYVIEVIVPKSRLQLLHFNKAGETWVRLEGCSKNLKGVALQEYILERSQKNT